MKSFLILLVLGAVVLADPVKVVESDAEEVSIIGYLKNVAVPAAEARRKLEEEYMQKNRITGGSPAQRGDVPFQAAMLTEIIGMTGQGVCGASLLSNNRLLTAAHCWFDGINQGWRATVVIGSVLLFGTDGHRQQTSVVVNHPQWNPAIIRNDVAIIYLANSVTFSYTILPVNLPSGDELSDTFVGATAYASGFGLTGDDVAQISPDQFLSRVEVEVISNTQCWLSFPLIVHNSNVCISGAGGRSTCRGDSGGPLFVNRNGRNVLIGVTSFGSALGCSLGRPAAFARVSSFVDFINQHLQ